jgi:hypothetical protein
MRAPVQASRLAVFIEAYQPKTFRERGVAAPFTTPLLTGARLRAAPARAGHVLEAIIPNPAGRRGVYIVPWSESGDLCRPTMHDARLAETLIGRLDLSTLCPAMVRQAGWEVAAEGHAGRGGAAAARRVLRDNAVRFAMMSTRLQSALARQETDAAPDPAAWERLTALLADIHLPEGALARLPALIDAVGALTVALAEWTAAQSGPVVAAAQMVGTAARLVHHGATYLLGMAVAQIDQPATLLRDWFADPVGVELALSRTEWLLDGWDRLVLLWQVGLPGPAVTVLEMAALLPVWPDEAEVWLELPAGTAAHLARRPALPSRLWTDPTMTVDQIARNERLRALVT